MFTILAVFLGLWPLSALLLEEKEVKQSELENATDQSLPGLGTNFYLLFTASILSSITGFFIDDRPFGLRAVESEYHAQAGFGRYLVHR